MRQCLKYLICAESGIYVWKRRNLPGGKVVHHGVVPQLEQRQGVAHPAERESVPE